MLNNKKKLFKIKIKIKSKYKWQTDYFPSHVIAKNWLIKETTTYTLIKQNNPIEKWNGQSFSLVNIKGNT